MATSTPPSYSPSSSIVLSQTNDLLALVHTLYDRSTHNVEQYRESAKTELASLYRELEIERLHHQETKDLLADENQKLHVLDSQLHALQRQLTREQTTFERAFGLLRSQELTNVSPQKMATQIAALSADCQKKEEELRQKEHLIETLYSTIKSIKESQRREREDLKLQTQHKNYLTNRQPGSNTRKNTKRN